MESPQRFSEPSVNFQYEEEDSIKQKSSSIPAPTIASENLSGGFDCNICLDSAHDPVVTLCGHLYCWPCIYKWLQVQNSSAVDSGDRPKCPVCKTSISNSSVVPLYGRGTSSAESESTKLQLGSAIPHRPPAIGANSQPSNAAAMGTYPHQQLHPNLFNPQPEPFQPQQYFQPQLPAFHQQPYFTHPFGSHASIGQSGIGNTAMTSFYSPTIGMFGEMVFSGIFGSSGPNLFAPAYPTYSSPRRVRRQELQVEKSLWRLNMFLVVCLVLCLLLF
ncbi:OLC1v1023045C1 [Oldenlandia corymbosa var. corymbosa]|uniref:E3 ubiquitin-protein ligase RMA n=1 Tax=Oldenlandia corymbosa var. corymbosa TaxID=529605 RepID=A0AAV1BZ36_OLDCO|nr:OLC1v1023045C1 [Oldenlandia corymbosa var. corymbosa]